MARAHYGIALDIGTSKLEGLLVDLSTHRTASFQSLDNSQRTFGPDVITRLHYAISRDSGLTRLNKAIIENITTLIRSLLIKVAVGEQDVARIVCVGNSAMHHLVLSISPRKLARSPFTPSHVRRIYRARASDVGLVVCADAAFEFLPNIGGFIGSDALAVIISCGIPSSSGLVGAIDLGTNGEVIVGDREKTFAASTSAGPAFEGWHISCGMPAVEGAIEAVRRDGSRLVYRVIGRNAEPKGVCGSGLIDVVKGLLDLGLLDENGRMKRGRFRLCGRVYVNQDDVREIQLAKAAIQAAVKIVRGKFGSRRLTKVFLTGRFGSRISARSAKAIGIVPEDVDPGDIRVMTHGALEGARQILSSKDTERKALSLYRKITHVELHRETGFQDEFVAAMRFSRASPCKGRGL